MPRLIERLLAPHVTTRPARPLPALMLDAHTPLGVFVELAFRANLLNAEEVAAIQTLQLARNRLRDLAATNNELMMEVGL